jgi:hypothetical protein
MKLCELHPKLSAEERQRLADKAGTDPGYLWQLATRWRGKRPSLDLIRRLADADKRLTLADMVKEFSAPADSPDIKTPEGA